MMQRSGHRGGHLLFADFQVMISPFADNSIKCCLDTFCILTHRNSNNTLEKAMASFSRDEPVVSLRLGRWESITCNQLNFKCN